MDHTAENGADDSCYAACEGVESTPKTKISVKQCPSLRLKESEKPNVHVKSPGSPAQYESDAKQIPLSYSRPQRKYLHGERKDQHKLDSASNTQKKHRSKQQSGDRVKGSIDKPKEELRIFKNSRNSRSPKFQKLQLHATTSPTEAAKTVEKDQKTPALPADTCSEKQDPEPAPLPVLHPIEIPAPRPEPGPPLHEDGSIPTQARDTHTADSPEYSAPGLNVYAEEFTPSSGYSLYTSQVLARSYHVKAAFLTLFLHRRSSHPLPQQKFKPHTTAPRRPQSIASLRRTTATGGCTALAKLAFTNSGPTVITPNVSYSVFSAVTCRKFIYPPSRLIQAYHSADDISKYRLQQQYYPYPVAFCPYNFIPMARMISSSADSRVRTVSYTQRVVPVALGSF